MKEMKETAREALPRSGLCEEERELLPPRDETRGAEGVFLPKREAKGAPWGQRDTRGEKHYRGVPLLFLFFFFLLA